MSRSWRLRLCRPAGSRVQPRNRVVASASLARRHCLHRAERVAVRPASASPGWLGGAGECRQQLSPCRHYDSRINGAAGRPAGPTCPTDPSRSPRSPADPTDQAHNPKVAGSNPAPAIQNVEPNTPPHRGVFRPGQRQGNTVQAWRRTEVKEGLSDPDTVPILCGANGQDLIKPAETLLDSARW
jgi:hypothetical protein